MEERRRLRLALGASHIPLRPKAACRLHSKSEGTTDRDTVSLTREGRYHITCYCKDIAKQEQTDNTCEVPVTGGVWRWYSVS